MIKLLTKHKKPKLIEALDAIINMDFITLGKLGEYLGYSCFISYEGQIKSEIAQCKKCNKYRGAAIINSSSGFCSIFDTSNLKVRFSWGPEYMRRDNTFPILDFHRLRYHFPYDGRTNKHSLLYNIGYSPEDLEEMYKYIRERK